MVTYEIGSMVRSKTGHDKDRFFIIIKTDAEYVYLVDGRLRTVEKPKKKRKKHVQWIGYYDRTVKRKLENSEIVLNEEFKRAIKLYRRQEDVKIRCN